MLSKYEGTSVPAYSHFVQLEDDQIAHVKTSWHKVNVGLQSADDLEDLYAWCDVNMHQEWCVIGTNLYFVDPGDAVHLKLMLSGAS